MKYIRLETTSPYYNLAVEEYLLRHAEDDVFMLWQNEPSVIIGKNQNAYAEVDLSFAEEKGIHVARRITGGGAVYHDLGNINYTFISVGGGGEPLDFEYFTRPMREALSLLGVTCTLGGRNDLECCGRKISGNAQHAEGGRILHHGTLLFDTDSEVMSGVLRVAREKLEHKGVKSVGARIVNLSELLPQKTSISDFLSQIEGEVCAELGAVKIDAPEAPEIQELYERNISPEWIFSEKRHLTKYALHRRRKYSFGLVDVEMTFDRDRICDIVISGDFFGTSPIEELESAIVGVNPATDNLPDPAPYIAGMTVDDLVELLG